MFSFATKFSPEAANFEKAVFSGYENAELFLTPTRLMSWRSLSKIARSYELSYVLHFPTSGKLSRQTCEEIVALSRDINCRIVSVHEADLDVAHHIRSLEPGIQLAVENQAISFEKLDDWIKANEVVTLNVDYLWKNTLQGCEFQELKSVVTRLVHNYGSRICNVHLSGYSPAQPTKKPLSQSREFASEIFDILLSENYQGFVVGEIDVEFQTSDNWTNDLEFFNDWKSQKGICSLSGDFVKPINGVPETL